MARIRSIHPGFWTDEATLEMSIQAQLFMIGLWNEADDGGAFAWKPRQLKARLMPMHNVDPEETLSELVQIGVIRKYESDGQEIGAIRNFGKWQSPKKPSRKFPMPGEIMQFCATENIPGTGKEQVEKTSEKSSKEPQDREEISEPVPHQFGTSSEPVPIGRGEEEEEEEDILSHSVREEHASDLAAPPKTKSPPSKRGHRLPDDWQPSPELIDYANERNLNPQREAEDFRDYWHARPGAGGVKLDWAATFRTWCRRSADRQQQRFLSNRNVTPFPSRMSRDEENRRASMDFLRGLANG
ncbi:DnaT-like ssDNA-binding domain-containing protein [Bombella sp. TMW 2.2559]|uniref:DnaT-like ssDNA-binding domain-containing protein n=1 Tax=Bombella dulcis TaxID=2967339 RepID=A0ABT3WAC8_9PROT|nr:DnaT-like ssDNA-binding domain-containing protein [Bombella dulcis]MCX5616030.1 DnaT-like ssDNA-binding domain-containing protein [Bombella dulcis]